MGLGGDGGKELAEHELEPVTGCHPFDIGRRGPLFVRGGDVAVAQPFLQVGEEVEQHAVIPGPDHVVNAPLHRDVGVRGVGLEDVAEEGVHGGAQHPVRLGVLVKLTAARQGEEGVFSSDHR